MTSRIASSRIRIETDDALNEIDGIYASRIASSRIRIETSKFTTEIDV